LNWDQNDAVFVDALRLFITKLNDESYKGALVVVEGQRDETALRSLGYTGKLFLLCHGGSVIKLVNNAKRFKKIILLLDLDNKGRSLTKKSAIVLEEQKIPIDLFFRRQLASLTHGKLQRVEDLDRYIKYFENDMGKMS
jgi:5S rRNA maturation endonuclease (ribonuclease M5)